MHPGFIKTLKMVTDSFFETVEYNAVITLTMALEGFVATYFNISRRPGSGEKIS